MEVLSCHVSVEEHGDGEEKRQNGERERCIYTAPYGECMNNLSKLHYAVSHVGSHTHVGQRNFRTSVPRGPCDAVRDRKLFLLMKREFVFHSEVYFTLCAC